MTMKCEEARPLIDVYADDQLELARSLEIEEHLESCPECGRSLQSARELSSAVRASGLYGEAPAGLHSRVRLAVLEEAGVRETRPLSPISPSRPALAWWRPLSIGLAAALILAVFGWQRLPFGSRPGEQNPLLAQEVLDSHVRSLMADHLFDVPSTDQHTVKPWFDGKLDFSPPVVDLTSDGFELTGGRLDYISGRPVATVVYRRRKHVINLSMWPEKNDAPLSAIFRNGYHLLHWQTRGMEYWAVSDLNPEELREFVRLLEAKSPPAK
jgi:anti-sigma factor RsiW